jgi:hypothetical protein
MNTTSDANSNVKATIKRKKPEASNFLTSFLGICILLLSVFMFFAINIKDKENKAVVAVPTAVKSNVAENKEWMDKTEQKIDEINSKLSTWSNRIWLMSIAHNENVYLNKKLQSKQGIADPGYIVLSEDWKLNKAPVTMRMTEEQQKKLVETIK